MSMALGHSYNNLVHRDITFAVLTPEQLPALLNPSINVPTFNLVNNDLAAPQKFFGKYTIGIVFEYN